MEIFDMVTGFAEISSGGMSRNCGNILRKKTHTFHYGLDYKKEGSQSNSLGNCIGASLFLLVQSEALFTNLL